MTAHVRELWQIIYLILHMNVLVEIRCSTREAKTAEIRFRLRLCLSTV